MGDFEIKLYGHKTRCCITAAMEVLLLYDFMEWSNCQYFKKLSSCLCNSGKWEFNLKDENSGIKLFDSRFPLPLSMKFHI